MIVGVMRIHIHMHGISSLKQKRSIVKSVRERVKNRFNVSCSEVGAHDNKNYAIIGIATVSNENKFVNHQLDKVINFMHMDGRFYVGQIERETF